MVFSPDGEFMWTGEEWIPAPPQTVENQPSPAVNQMQVNEEIAGNALIPSSVPPESVDSIFEKCPHCGHELYPGWRKCNSCQQPVNTSQMPQIQDDRFSQLLSEEDSIHVQKYNEQIQAWKRGFKLLILIVALYAISDYFDFQIGKTISGAIGALAFIWYWKLRRIFISMKATPWQVNVLMMVFFMVLIIILAIAID
jgi:hypothetical protein